MAPADTVLASFPGHRALVVIAVCLAIVGMSGCGVSPSPAPFPVEGSRTDIASLVGAWSGRYWSDEQPRYGTLTFRFRSESDTAYGEVEMEFAPGLRLYSESAKTPLSRSPCTILNIAVVRMAGDSVRGTLAPYWDPDCDCRTHTVFEGRVAGDSVAGTFSSRRESTNMPLLTGKWFAVRD